MSRRSYEKPPSAELEKKLTRMQFAVTQKDATEPPFQNEFWNEHASGIFVDVATGEPLFSSLDKFDSGTGWPSFTRPIEDGRVVERTDVSHGMRRTEVRSRSGDSHLGHLFDDGPAPTGQRYCINSAALRFVAKDRLASEGYEEYRSRFEAGAVPPPPARDNACAVPASGQPAGCETTLETAMFSGGGPTRVALGKLSGVLEVESGTADGTDALRVVFDPAQLAFPVLFEHWASLGGPDGARRVAFFTSPAQRQAIDEWAVRRPGRSPSDAITVRNGSVVAFHRLEGG